MEVPLFYLFAAVSVATAAVVVVSRRPTYGALALILCFCSLAGLYGLLGAPLVAAIQIIVYAGAIMVLFLLVIMLLDVRGESRYPDRRDLLGWAGAAGGALLAAELIHALARDTRGPAAPEVFSTGTPAAVGEFLFQSYLMPFEATTALFLVALIGATWVARR
jgi:NADH-quinone oxidoreductase subunit J